MHKLPLCAVVLIAVAACSSVRAEGSYPSLYSQAINLCVEYYLPNSMARPPGFDLSAHLDGVQAERKKISAQFANPPGRQYIQQQLSQEHDELNIKCAQELLRDAQVRTR